MARARLSSPLCTADCALDADSGRGLRMPPEAEEDPAPEARLSADNDDERREFESAEKDPPGEMGAKLCR